MNTYLVFLRNMSSRQDFVAPYSAASATAAEQAALVDYPTGQYMLLTVYAEPELQVILANIHRWPGVPSNVEAAKGKPGTRPVAQVRSAVGGLPPLHKPQPQAPGFKLDQRPTGAVVQGPSTAGFGSLVEPKQTPSGGLTLAEAMAALRGGKPADINPYGGKQAEAKTDTTAQPGTAKNQSVIDVLRSLRS